MLLDKYKRQYKFKSNQRGNDKALWISLLISAVVIAVLWYFA
jgi:hypothetical protein